MNSACGDGRAARPPAACVFKGLGGTALLQEDARLLYIPAQGQPHILLCTAPEHPLPHVPLHTAPVTVYPLPYVILHQGRPTAEESRPNTPQHLRRELRLCFKLARPPEDRAGGPGRA